MDTSVSTSFGDRVNNIGLMSEKNSKIQFGGLAFISGILLYALDKQKTNNN